MKQITITIPDAVDKAVPDFTPQMIRHIVVQEMERAYRAGHSPPPIDLSAVAVKVARVDTPGGIGPPTAAP